VTTNPRSARKGPIRLDSIQNRNGSPALDPGN
jgi:hypothetical protein